MNTKDFNALLKHARSIFNSEWYETISNDRCVPYRIKHKRWVYRIVNKNNMFLAIVGHYIQNKGTHYESYEYDSEYGWKGPCFVHNAQ